MSNNQLGTDQKTDSAIDSAKEKTREHGRYLWDIVARYSRIKDLTNSAPEPSKQSPE
ncbi:MAG: hypothetical protein U5J63_01440 [Fodinibius sp.]|nr:hypothetical protein [Fodinibius sp.]